MPHLVCWRSPGLGRSPREPAAGAAGPAHSPCQMARPAASARLRANACPGPCQAGLRSCPADLHHQRQAHETAAGISEQAPLLNCSSHKPCCMPVADASCSSSRSAPECMAPGAHQRNLENIRSMGGPGSGQSACSQSSGGGSSSYGIGSRAYSMTLDSSQERVANWRNLGMAHPVRRGRGARWAAAPTWHAGAHPGSLCRAGPLRSGAAPGGSPCPWGLRGGGTCAPARTATHVRATHSAPRQAAIRSMQCEAGLAPLQSLSALRRSHSGG